MVYFPVSGHFSLFCQLEAYAQMGKNLVCQHMPVHAKPANYWDKSVKIHGVKPSVLLPQQWEIQCAQRGARANWFAVNGGVNSKTRLTLSKWKVNWAIVPALILSHSHRHGHQTGTRFLWLNLQMAYPLGKKAKVDRAQKQNPAS